MPEMVLQRETNGVVTLVLNRPDKLNAFADDMREQLLAAIERTGRSGARVMVITGAGRAFCSGGDVRNMVALKERDELYQIHAGGLKIIRNGTDTWKAEALFHLPSRLKAGSYDVTLWIVQDGVVVRERHAVFEAKLEGAPAFLNALARQHAVLYGIVAAVVAMAAGFFIGFVFHRGDGHH